MANQMPLIATMLPELTLGTDEFAIATAVLAYATGDAFGVSYEFEPLVKAPIPKRMLGKADWPAGGVSDDTLLSLMTISCLDSPSPSYAAETFKVRLRANVASLRGLGPTTRHALGIFVEEREVGIIGVTNGGMMRTALLALGFSGLQNPHRQTWVRELCSATHFKTEALYAALLMAEVFASALELKKWTVAGALKLARENVADVPEDISAQLDDAATFVTPPQGVSLNPIETLLAVLSIAAKSETVWDAYEGAICAGGDTDPLAALAASLIALRNPESFYQLPFIQDVNWQEIPEVADRIRLLLANRALS
jgi:ADP-ribosylglycohydrolase